MDDCQARLVKCFQAVFPELSVEEITRASLASVATWDSVRTIVLVTVMEEEFGLEIDANDLQELISFELILDYLGRTR